MNQVAPKKLLNSKWTSTQPINKAKHFAVVTVEFDEDGKVILCELEAVLSKKIEAIDWRDLKDSKRWKQGWK